MTTDWLLSETEPEEEKTEEPQAAVLASNTSWVDSIPGAIGNLIRRYGWLFGVYTALSGLGFTVMGALARIITQSMFSGSMFNMDDTFGSGTIWYDELGSQIASPYGESVSSFATNNPVAIMGTAIMIIGIVLMVTWVREWSI